MEGGKRLDQVFFYWGGPRDVDRLQPEDVIAERRALLVTRPILVDAAKRPHLLKERLFPLPIGLG
jgi:hypothetical protein